MAKENVMQHLSNCVKKAEEEHLKIEKLTKEHMVEVKMAFKKQYPAQFKVVFGEETNVYIKYASTQWHAFKCGYFSAKGLI